MWPVPKGPSYKDQIKDLSTKFTIASSESGENVASNEQSSEGNRVHDTAFHENFPSSENRENTSRGRREFSDKDSHKPSSEAESKETSGEYTGPKTGKNILI